MDQDLLKIKGVISEVRVLRPQPTDIELEKILMSHFPPHFCAVPFRTFRKCVIEVGASSRGCKQKNKPQQKLCLLFPVCDAADCSVYSIKTRKALCY